MMSVPRQAILFIAAFLMVIGTSGCQREMTSGEPVAATINKDGNMKTYKYRNENVGTIYTGESVTILERSYNFCKILKSDGTMGWVKEDMLVPTKETYIKTRTLMYTESGLWNSEKIGWLDQKTAVTRLEEKQVNTTLQATKIRTSDMQEGWINSADMETVAADSWRIVKRQDWEFGRDRFIKTWTNVPADVFLRKFGEQFAVQLNEDGQIWYYFNIKLYGDHKRYNLTTVAVTDDKITDVHVFNKQQDWISYLPLATVIRSPFLINHFQNIVRITENHPYDQDINNPSKRPDWPQWLSVAAGTVFIVVWLGLYFAILYVPYFTTNRLGMLRSKNKAVSNKSLMIYVTILAVVFGYVYFLFTGTNFYPYKDHFFWYSAIAFLTLANTIRAWRIKINYERCDVCREWSGVDDGSELLQEKQFEETATFRDGHTESAKGWIQYWKDKRLCTTDDCRNRWFFIRRETFGGLKF